MKNFKIDVYKKKVFNTIKKYKLIQPNDVIYIGLSGGKDSTAACYLLNEYKKVFNIDCKIVAFHIHMGDFVPMSVIEVVKKQAVFLGVELEIYNIKDFGIDYVTLSKLDRPLCSSCGVIKRYLLNKIPKDKKANKIATGHHGDDYLVFFMRNMIGGNIDWISKFTPKIETYNNLLSRIRPLFFVSGEDNRNFCKSVGIEYLEDYVCPHKILNLNEDIRRKKWYQTIDEIERWQPNFKENFLRSIVKFASVLQKSLSMELLKECKICGEPTNLEICGFCKLKSLLENFYEFSRANK